MGLKDTNYLQVKKGRREKLGLKARSVWRHIYMNAPTFIVHWCIKPRIHWAPILGFQPILTTVWKRVNLQIQYNILRSYYCKHWLVTAATHICAMDWASLMQWKTFQLQNKVVNWKQSCSVQLILTPASSASVATSCSAQPCSCRPRSLPWDALKYLTIL